MSKKTSSKTETEQVIATAAPVVPAAIVAAPVEKKARKPKAVKTDDAVVTASTTATTTATTAAPATEDVETSLTEQSVEFLAKLQQLGSLISSLKTEYRTC